MIREAIRWTRRLVRNKILTPLQARRLESSHCATLGADGKTYGLHFDPSTQPPPNASRLEWFRTLPPTSPICKPTEHQWSYSYCHTGEAYRVCLTCQVHEKSEVVKILPEKEKKTGQ